MRNRSGVATSPRLILAFSLLACAHGQLPASESPNRDLTASGLACRDDDSVASVNQAEAHDSMESPDAHIPERRSISLGTSFVPPRWYFGYGTTAAMLPMSPTIVVNNYYQPNPLSAYGGTVVSPYYYSGVVSSQVPTGANRVSGIGSGRGSAVLTSSTSTPRLGGDWPAIPSFGPQMPSKSAPAPVWAR